MAEFSVYRCVGVDLGRGIISLIFLIVVMYTNAALEVRFIVAKFVVVGGYLLLNSNILLCCSTKKLMHN